MQHSYLQLAARLQHDIEAGRYASGERLPSVRIFAAAHDVSVSTALRCYRELETLGLVQARSKSGMYVADWKTHRAARQKCSEVATAVPLHYDELVSMQHRMTQLYSLSEQSLPFSLHISSAAPAWYPTDAYAKIGQQVLRHDANLLGTFPPVSGMPQLKTALAQWLAHCGVDVPASDVLITNGCTEALSLALRAVTQPGDVVAVESPVYFGLLQMIDNLGLKVVELPCVPGKGMSLEALEYALEHQSIRAVVAMPSFQNPLGCAMDDKSKRRLLKLVDHYDIALIEDDVYGDIRNLGPNFERLTPVKAWDRHGRVVYCGSSSKSFAPGFRVGWVSGGRYHARISSLKLSSSLVTPMLEQALLAQYLQSGALPAHLRRLRERLTAVVPHAVACVQQYFPAGTQILSTAGGWWLWLALPEHTCTLTLLRRSIAFNGLSFTPGVVFSASPKYTHCLRVNIARPWGRDMEQALKKLGYLARMPA